jgi:hypothetical protein
MESGELLNLFRCDVVDDVEPYLWTDLEAYQYMNDAYFMFVRLTGGIADGSSSVTQLTATTGEATTPIDDSIMRVRTVRNTSNSNRPVEVINVQDIDILTTEDYGIVHNISQIDTPGRPEYMVIGEEDGYVRWVNVPDADYVMQLVVERLPTIPITREKERFTGVRQEHHFHLLKWMRHLAYRKQDADTFNLVKSDQERDDFVAYCEMANNEKSIRRHKVRATGYGGI